MVQLTAGARLAQSFVCEKSLGLEPESATLEIVSVAWPEFVTATVCTELLLPRRVSGKVTLPGTSVTTGSGVRPWPVRGTLCGLPGALSLMARDAERVPAADGLKTTLMVQFRFGERA